MSEIKVTVDGQQYEQSGYRSYTDVDVVIRYGKEEIVFKPKQIPDKGYEILSFLGVNNEEVKWQGKSQHFGLEYDDWVRGCLGYKYQILLVKRLPDNEQFKLGDRFTYFSREVMSPISEFIIVDGVMKVKVDSILAPIELNHIKLIKPPVKVPLFTTEDGVEIFDQDYYYVLINWEYELSKAYPNCLSGDRNVLKYFSTEQAAMDYVMYNRPVQMTLKDFISDIRAGYKYGVGIMGEEPAIEAFKKRIQINLM